MKTETINTPVHPSISVAEFMLQVRKLFPKTKLKHIRMTALKAETLLVADGTSVYEAGKQFAVVIRSPEGGKSKQVRYNKNPR